MSEIALLVQLAAVGLAGIAGVTLAGLFRGVSVPPFTIFAASIGPIGLAWAAAPLPLPIAPLGWSLVLVAGLCCLATFDAGTRTVPDIVTIPMIVLGVLHAALVGAPHLLFGLSAAALILFAVAFHAVFRGRGTFVGGGDVLLVAGALAWFGPSMIPDLAILASVVLLFQLAPRLVRIPRSGACIPPVVTHVDELPLAPSLAVAQLVVWFGGPLF